MPPNAAELLRRFRRMEVPPLVVDEPELDDTRARVDYFVQNKSALVLPCEDMLQTLFDTFQLFRHEEDNGGLSQKLVEAFPGLLNQRDKHGRTALMAAVFTLETDLRRDIFNIFPRFTDVAGDGTDEDGRTVAHYMVMGGDDNCFDTLALNDSLFYATDIYGNNVFHLAVFYAIRRCWEMFDSSCMKSLARMAKRVGTDKLDPNARNASGYTPLMMAVASCGDDDGDVLRDYFLFAGDEELGDMIDVLAVDGEGFTAIEYARAMGKGQIAQILSEVATGGRKSRKRAHLLGVHPE